MTDIRAKQIAETHSAGNRTPGEVVRGLQCCRPIHVVAGRPLLDRAVVPAVCGGREQFSASRATTVTTAAWR